MQANDIVGKWRVISKIGQGSYSEVYSAHDEHDHLVAIKVERESMLHCLVMPCSLPLVTLPPDVRDTLHHEQLVLKRMQKYPFVCRRLYYGYVAAPCPFRPASF